MFHIFLRFILSAEKKLKITYFNSWGEIWGFLKKITIFSPSHKLPHRNYTALFWKKGATHIFEKMELGIYSDKRDHVLPFWTLFGAPMSIFEKFTRKHPTNLNKTTRNIDDLFWKKGVTEKLLPSLKINLKLFW